MYYVYILVSMSNNQIYIGSTNDLERRLLEHNNGEVFSTKRYKPWTLHYYEAFNMENLARLREKRLKYSGNSIRELKKRIGL
ncbi:GIY-YIG nuclease family protein [Candidatus Daviesbacteria bacterium]|nr:GIY-YIG nuclease family protein [Candidatus Daviesbacteria bacterium]